MEVLEDLNDDFRMKKIALETLNFPIVIKKIADELVFSTPDLGLFKSIKIPLGKNTPETSKSSNLNLSKDFKDQILAEIESLWISIENHREEKKWQPIPSTFKQSLSKGEEDYSLPEFVKKLNNYMSVSENTIRREIKRGVIRCFQTEGGHRRIPVSELATYLKRTQISEEKTMNSKAQSQEL